MKKINIKKFIYHVRHQYLNLNNVVVGVGLFVAISWAWGSLDVMQRNYALQSEVEDKTRQLKLLELQAANLRFQQRYFNSDEYKELAVRDRLGLVEPGESVIILPPNSKLATRADEALQTSRIARPVQSSNFEQWMNFIFGGNSKRLSTTSSSDAQ